MLATSGILTHTVATGETALDAVESSIAALRTGPALAAANVLVLHPNTWYAMRKATDNYGRYLIAPDPTRDVTDSLWGVSVLQTTQIAPGAAVLLDTSKFGRIHLRESLSLRVGFANDDLIRNLTSSSPRSGGCWLSSGRRPS
ncbi:phage major capsid protein [Mycobacterium sp. 852002-51057_SCH5723018]|uniref:phage major capsid protein n=1 Tax=Mycobacterium sp. 852002-51057_SCH5723018 TaxID=1834094 RepID=UPI0008020BE6|nr:phage major capsid protein [Mycobacterium sp. 852002-51057_SCH5723018]OBG24198.1 hypothetical protein A5764_00865 [Mycobacterium sp. 852002-51057_SCH5723018]